MSLPKLSLKNIRRFTNHIKWAHSLARPGMNKKKHVRMDSSISSNSSNSSMSSYSSRSSSNNNNHRKKYANIYKKMRKMCKPSKRRRNILPRQRPKKKDKPIVLTPRTIKGIDMYVSSVKYF